MCTFYIILKVYTATLTTQACVRDWAWRVPAPPPPATQGVQAKNINDDIRVARRYTLRFVCAWDTNADAYVALFPRVQMWL